MKSTKHLILFIILTLVIANHFTYAQEKIKHNTFGISASIQDSQFDIMLPFVISNSAIIAPAIGVSSVSKAGSDISLGFVARFYLKNAKVKPFLGARFGALVFSPSKSEGSYSDPKSTTDFVVGLLAGGEYFLDEGFSLGVEAQLNASISDENSSRFGNPGGVNVNTGAAVFATVYF